VSTAGAVGAWLEPWDLDAGKVFAVFEGHDSGCSSCGIENDAGRWFVKTSVGTSGAASMERAVRFHAAVAHPVIVRPVHVLRRRDDVRLVYPWREGRVLHQATASGNDRSGLEAFRALDTDEVRSVVSNADRHRRPSLERRRVRVRRRQSFAAAIAAASSASFSWWVRVSLTELSRQPSGVRTATSS
jgi:hypothetical protein